MALGEAEEGAPGQVFHRVLNLARHFHWIIAAVNVFNHENRAETLEIIENPEGVPGGKPAAVKEAVFFVRDHADLVFHLVFHFIVEPLIEVHRFLGAA